VELLDDELRVEEEVDPVGAQVARQRERPDDAGPLGDVVGLMAERLGDRRVRRSQRVERVGP
jgi:hypothetical protein